MGAVATASKVVLSPDGLGSRRVGLPNLQLLADAGSDVGSLDVKLGDDLLPRLGANRWGTSRLRTSTHSMVAFTWAARDPAPHIQINSRVAGSWQGWRRVASLHDLPDADVLVEQAPGVDVVRGVLDVEEQHPDVVLGAGDLPDRRLQLTQAASR